MARSPNLRDAIPIRAQDESAKFSSTGPEYPESVIHEAALGTLVCEASRISGVRFSLKDL